MLLINFDQLMIFFSTLVHCNHFVLLVITLSQIIYINWNVHLFSKTMDFKCHKSFKQLRYFLSLLWNFKFYDLLIIWLNELAQCCNFLNNGLLQNVKLHQSNQWPTPSRGSLYLFINIILIIQIIIINIRIFYQNPYVWALQLTPYLHNVSLSIRNHGGCTS